MDVHILVCCCNKLHKLLDLAQMEHGEASLMDATIIAPVIVLGRGDDTLRSWCLQEEHCLLILALFNFSSHFFFSFLSKWKLTCDAV